MNRLFGAGKKKEEPKPVEAGPSLGDCSAKVSYFLKISSMLLLKIYIYIPILAWRKRRRNLEKG